MDMETIKELSSLNRKIIMLEVRVGSMEYLESKRIELAKQRREKVISMFIALVVALVIVAFALYVPRASKIDTQGNLAVVDRQTLAQMHLSEQELRMELGE